MKGRFVTLAFCIVLDSLCGLQYMYGTFSGPIKDQFNLKQDVIDRGGLAQNIGANLGLHAGLLLDTFGPKPMILLGAVLGLVSYSLLFFAIHFDWDLHNQTFGLYAILFLQGQAQLMADMSVVPTVSKRFRENTGLALGICKSFLGLGGSIAEQLYVAFFKPDSVTFILFLALFFPTICLTSSAFVTPGHEPDTSNQAVERRRLEVAHVIGTALRGMPVLVTLLMFALLSKFFMAESRVLNVTLTLLILVLIALMCVYIASFGDGYSEEDELQQGLLDNEEVAAQDQQSQRTFEQVLEEEEQEEQGDDDNEEVQEEQRSKDEEFTLWHAVRQVRFWLHWVCVVVAWGAGLLLIINVGQLCEIAGISKDNKDIFVSLVSIFNCIGRLFFGGLSDYLLRRGFLRVRLFALVTIAMGFSTYLLSFATHSTLVLATVLVGFLYGGVNVLNPAILGDLYGVHRIGTFYSSMMLATIAGSYLIATTLFAAVYEAHATTAPGESEDSCVGSACILASSHIAAGLCIGVGTLYFAFATCSSTKTSVA